MPVRRAYPILDGDDELLLLDQSLDVECLTIRVRRGGKKDGGSGRADFVPLPAIRRGSHEDTAPTQLMRPMHL